MILYPAIDIYDGKCVRLSQGKFDQATIYFDNPLDAAKKWADLGAEWLHVVDLNGSREGRPVNLNPIEEIVTKLNIPTQIGGGIRSAETTESYLSMGASRIVLGSVAIENPKLVDSLCQKHERKIAVGLDARDGKVAIHGWEKTVNKEAIVVAKEFEEIGLAFLIYTDISRDGMLTGPNFEMTQKMISDLGLSVIASGGISNLEDLKKLKEIGASGAILGRSLYEGKIELAEALNL